MQMQLVYVHAGMHTSAQWDCFSIENFQHCSYNHGRPVRRPLEAKGAWFVCNGVVLGGGDVRRAPGLR